jgi:hypothetical protein
MQDYSKIDKKVEIIIKKVVLYVDYFDKDYVKNEILNAYNYAKEAHEGQFRLS